MSEVLDALKDEHFRLVSPEEALEGKRFCVDSLCHDVLMFSPECANDLVKNHLVTAGKLVLQVHGLQIEAFQRLSFDWFWLKSKKVKLTEYILKF